MPKREKGPLSPEQPELVWFNSVECCALEYGFSKNPAAIASLREFIDEKTLKSAFDDLADSNHVAFQRNKHNVDIETAYRQIAGVELARLSSGEEKEKKLGCGHFPNEHKKALQAIVEKLKKSVN